MRRRQPAIQHAGACVTTRNVALGLAPIRWLDREAGARAPDSGWRLLSAVDTTEYLSDGNNWVVVDYRELSALEPMLLAVWDFPVGSQLELVRDGEPHFVDLRTGRSIPRESLAVLQ
ncbi:DUF2185 domain-containing protein [Micrococcales bacterium 31B]|nr:DUF2185 domain-containing protein [Micrococcales bacterium 31B]